MNNNNNNIYTCGACTFTEVRDINVPPRRELVDVCAKHVKHTKPYWDRIKPEPVFVELQYSPMYSIYCHGCNESWASKHPHKKANYGHWFTYEDFPNGDSPEFWDSHTYYMKAWKAWAKATRIRESQGWRTRGQLSMADLKGIKEQHSKVARMIVSRGGGVYNEQLVWTNGDKSMDAKGLFNFSMRRLIKVTYNRDWDLYQKETRGLDLLEDLASTAVEKFLTAQSRNRRIRNPYSYLSACINSAVMDYRRERAKMRLTIVPHDVMDYVESLGISDPNATMDVYETIKQKPHTKVDIHTLTKLLDEKDIKVKPAHIRAVFNALIGKNRGLQGNQTTRRYIRHVIQQLKEVDDSALYAIHAKLTSTEHDVDMQVKKELSTVGIYPNIQ
jgi:hypothetical protein